MTKERELLQQSREALKEISAMYSHAWDRDDDALVMLPPSIPRFESAHEGVAKALAAIDAYLAAPSPAAPAQDILDDCRPDPISDHEQAALYNFTMGTPHYNVVRKLYRAACATPSQEPSEAREALQRLRDALSSQAVEYPNWVDRDVLVIEAALSAAAQPSEASERKPIQLSDYINAAHIIASDMPATVVEKLQASIDAAIGGIGASSGRPDEDANHG